MSVYDYRDKPAYENFRTEPHYCENIHILKWWTPSHDELLNEQIEKEQWNWYWGITNKIVAMTPPENIKSWRRKDKLCSQYAWYNVLMYFAVARAEQLGLTKKIRKPKWKTCPLCNQQFVEDSLPSPLVQRLGVDELDFCAPCLRDAVLHDIGNDTMRKQDILVYIRDLAETIQRVPPQNFGEEVKLHLVAEPRGISDMGRIEKCINL